MNVLRWLRPATVVGYAQVLFFVLLTSWAISPLVAQTPVTGQGLSLVQPAVPFLTITPDSRHGALGDAGVALADNANALYWNPANLAFTKNRFGMALNYTPWLRFIIPDINLAYVPFYLNLGERAGVVGGSLTYFSLGRIEFRDNQGIAQGDYTANEFAISLAYSRKISKNFSAAIQLRYIRSDLAGAQNTGTASLNPGTSFSGDLSLAYTKEFKKGLFGGDKPTTLNFGMNMSNLGNKIRYSGNTDAEDFLPSNFRIGTALRSYLDEYNSITFLFDINKLMVPYGQAQEVRNKPLLEGIFGSFTTGPALSLLTFSSGLEYWYNDVFAARLGYYREDPVRGNRSYFTIGVGTKIREFHIDFAYLQPLTQQNPLQNTLRFTVGYQLKGGGILDAREGAGAKPKPSR